MMSLNSFLTSLGATAIVRILKMRAIIIRKVASINLVSLIIYLIKDIKKKMEEWDYHLSTHKFQNQLWQFSYFNHYLNHVWHLPVRFKPRVLLRSLVCSRIFSHLPKKRQLVVSSCRGGNRTHDLQDMNLTRYLFSTLRYLKCPPMPRRMNQRLLLFSIVTTK